MAATRYVTSKDRQRTVLVPATDELHALAWGRLYQGSKPDHVTGPVAVLSEVEARDWLNRERAVGQISTKDRLAALRAPKTDWLSVAGDIAGVR